MVHQSLVLAGTLAQIDCDPSCAKAISFQLGRLRSRRKGQQLKLKDALQDGFRMFSTCCRGILDTI